MIYFIIFLTWLPKQPIMTPFVSKLSISYFNCIQPVALPRTRGMSTPVKGGQGQVGPIDYPNLSRLCNSLLLNQCRAYTVDRNRPIQPHIFPFPGLPVPIAATTTLQAQAYSPSHFIVIKLTVLVSKLCESGRTQMEAYHVIIIIAIGPNNNKV